LKDGIKNLYKVKKEEDRKKKKRKNLVRSHSWPIRESIKREHLRQVFRDEPYHTYRIKMAKKSSLVPAARKLKMVEKMRSEGLPEIELKIDDKDELIREDDFSSDEEPSEEEFGSDVKMNGDMDHIDIGPGG
jgi:hypothetical protein